MQRMHSTVGIAIGMTVGLVLAVAAPAYAGGRVVKMRTGSVDPDPNGYVNCAVSATGGLPISLVATVRAPDGTDVTDFGTSFRASPAATGDGYRAEETAGSLTDGACYCQVKADGARRSDIDVTLTAYRADGSVLASVTAR